MGIFVLRSKFSLLSTRALSCVAPPSQANKVEIGILESLRGRLVIVEGNAGVSRALRLSECKARAAGCSKPHAGAIRVLDGSKVLGDATNRK